MLQKLYYDYIFLFVENCYNKMGYMIVQYGWEPVLIQRILFDFEAILEKQWSLKKENRIFDIYVRLGK